MPSSKAQPIVVEAPPLTGIWLLDLIMQPGASLQLVPAINATLVILLVVLAIMHWKGQTNVHVTVMALLAVGLLASLNW